MAPSLPRMGMWLHPDPDTPRIVRCALCGHPTVPLWVTPSRASYICVTCWRGCLTNAAPLCDDADVAVHRSGGQNGVTRIMGENWRVGWFHLAWGRWWLRIVMVPANRAALFDVVLGR